MRINPNPINFNFEYVLIEGFAKKPEEIDFKITEDIHIKGNYYKKFIKGSDSYYLYKVSNVRELVENEEFALTSINVRESMAKNKAMSYQWKILSQLVKWLI